MSTTKKQKKLAIPKIEYLITELKNDLSLVNNERTKEIIKGEIQKQEEKLKQYTYEIEQPNNRRLW